MTALRLRGEVEQAIPLAYPQELCFSFFARNEDLLRRFLGEDRVTVLEPGVYRVRLNPHGALGLTLRPSFDVAFDEVPPDRVEMRSLAARLDESSHHDAGFDARFNGLARFDPAPEGACVMHCAARTEVDLALPALLAWMPKSFLEGVGNGIVQTAMHALASQLGPLLRREMAAWVARRGEPAALEMPDSD